MTEDIVGEAPAYDSGPVVPVRERRTADPAALACMLMVLAYLLLLGGGAYDAFHSSGGPFNTTDLATKLFFVATSTTYGGIVLVALAAALATYARSFVAGVAASSLAAANGAVAIVGLVTTFVSDSASDRWSTRGGLAGFGLASLAAAFAVSAVARRSRAGT